MKRPELLSPAGSYRALIGAVNAGADAVYFGGDRFSARAYAENFTVDEAIEAIRYARLWGVKTYLTVNTLAREDELRAVADFVAPYAKAGLSGVLVQDFGVLSAVREAFPHLAVHASTQMAVTGVHGARMLKRMGVKRVVPARELTLPELSRLRQEADIEVEAFVHGAMCYCYSGMCLFSGMIGGRSGNRGRCAQACRLPYRAETEKGGRYYLSMKDLCGLTELPALIEAGVDAFKIEGRMKKPQYAAGVTAIYRKYIDRYLASKKAYEIDDEDMDALSKLYQRTDTQTGYLRRHNAKELVTVTSPAYNQTDEALLQSIEERYLKDRRKIETNVRCVMRAGRPVEVVFEARGARVTASGATVQTAVSRPMTKEEIVARLKKLNDTYFVANKVEVTFDDADARGVFLPVGALNEARRDAASALTNALLERAS